MFHFQFRDSFDPEKQTKLPLSIARLVGKIKIHFWTDVVHGVAVVVSEIPYWEPLAVWKATPKRTSIEWVWLPSLTAPQVNLSIAYESGVEFQMEFAVEVSFLGPRKFWWFHIVILQRTAKKCTQFENARAELLFCSLDLLFYHVPLPSWFAKGPYYLNCTPFEHKVPHVQETENITHLTIKPSCLQGTISTCLRTWISRERKHQTLRFITWNGLNSFMKTKKEK